MLILIDGAVEHKGSGECFRKSREAFLRCITSAILPDSFMVDRFAGFLPEIRGDFTYAPCRFFFAGFNDGLSFKTRQFLFLFSVMASTYLQGLAGFALRADLMIDQMPHSGPVAESGLPFF